MRLRPRADSSDLDEARAIAERLARPLAAAAPPARRAAPFTRLGPSPSPPLPPSGPPAVPGAAVPPSAPAADVRPARTAPAEAGAGKAEPAPSPAAKPPEPEQVQVVPEALEAEVTPAQAGPLAEEPGAVTAPVEEELESEVSLLPEAGEAVQPLPTVPAEDLQPEAEAGPEEFAPEPSGVESLVEEPAVEADGSPSGEWELAEEPASDESPLSALSDMVSEEPVAPAPPSWDELVANARDLSETAAVMVIGPDGRLLAATDGWPAVGPAAIANKLLPMVAPKLANPGALVPVKLSGQILSVWRVEVAGQLVTAAVLSEKALPVIVRPDIDELLGQGTLSA